MLQSLSIRNYALIHNIDIKFQYGFSTITGETGAGKTILLGALSLILGQRADTGVLNDKTAKCIVEAGFNIADYDLKPFFAQHELDYDKNTIIRREINEKGKSRAFINDTPVTLNVLKELGVRLVDVHSQHQNLALSDNRFQMHVIDSFAGHLEQVSQYKKTYIEFKNKTRECDELREKAEKSKSDLDYFQFQFNQLEEANLQEDEQKTLENELETLSHAEEIKMNLLTASGIISAEERQGILDMLKEAENGLERIRTFYPQVEDLFNRLESAYLELKDLAGELEYQGNEIEYDPERISFINQRLDTIYQLQQKHRTDSIARLIEIKQELEDRITEVTSFDEEIEKKSAALEKLRNTLEKTANDLSENRKNAIPSIEKEITRQLTELGMPGAAFKIILEETPSITAMGKEKAVFTFSANKNAPTQDIAKVASGGELSRLMLSIKALISASTALPTIIFDEIDTGLSGEIADKTGRIMKKMAENMQVISITHLPQIAGKGKEHFVVFKYDEKDATVTTIKQLNDKERVTELAKMLSGEELTDAAVENAKALLAAE